MSHNIIMGISFQFVRRICKLHYQKVIKHIYNGLALKYEDVHFLMILEPVQPVKYRLLKIEFLRLKD